MDYTFEEGVITEYINNIETEKFHRYESWQHCYDAFSVDQYTDIHPLHLGFFLASWGMYRGSGGLLQKNHLIHSGACEILFSEQYHFLKCSENTEITINNLDRIMELKKDLSKHYHGITFSRKDRLSKENKSIGISSTDTLMSKVLLGTFGCVPAYDRYFIAGIKVNKADHDTFSKESLNEIFNFIQNNKIKIVESQQIIKDKTNKHYPVMKIIDMYFWQIGYRAEKTKREKDETKNEITTANNLIGLL